MSCFGLEQDAQHPKCKACPHFVECQRCMGMRANRITLDKALFNFLPPGLPRKHATAIRNPDLDSIYQSSYRQIFGSNPGHSLNLVADKVSALAQKASVSVPMYVLTNMVGFQLAWPDMAFGPNHLVDNRALYRVRIYAETCRAKFGAFDVHTLDNVTGGDAEVFDLKQRMGRSELLAGHWIIDWKLRHEGAPFDAMFTALEPQLDPNWLAIETRYTQRMLQHTRHPTTADRRRITATVTRLKRRSHEARANFMAREEAMPTALKHALNEIGYAPNAFEVTDQPITDPLRLWHKLALAIQHMECLRHIDTGQSYYS